MTNDHGRPKDAEGAQRDLRGAQEERRAGAAPLVSVVIPCYNQAHFLGEAIESVLAHGHRRSQVVVVDGSSADDTSEVADATRVRSVRQHNRWLPAVCNSGIAWSTRQLYSVPGRRRPAAPRGA